MAIATAPTTTAQTTTEQPTFLSPAHEAAVARAESLKQTSDFAKPADNSTLEATVAALKDKGYDVHGIVTRQPSRPFRRPADRTATGSSSTSQGRSPTSCSPSSSP